MENIKQYIIDYIEGRVSSAEFYKRISEAPTILNWLKCTAIHHAEGLPEEERLRFQDTDTFLIEEAYKELTTQLGETQLGKEYNMHDWITRHMRRCFPTEDFQVDDTLQKKTRFLLEACPEYLSSIEIENAGILENLMEEIPESMGKTKRKKAFREKLKAMFYVEGQKYPRWIQSSEWPLSKTGKPTKFLRQKNKGEVSYYYFLDVDTNEEIEIMQAY